MWNFGLPSLEQTIRDLSDGWRSLTDAELLARAREQRWRIQEQAGNGKFADEQIVQVFALVREAARRERNEAHYPVQLRAGLEMVRGRVVEMQTGEGKTLTATLPVAFHALAGRGVHAMTVNDYLARRDAESMGPVYARLGLSTGFLQNAQEPGSPERKSQYDCDITYGTVTEFGFDFLRDRLQLLGQRRESRSQAARATVQRSLYFAMIDEADSILLDEARTPLILNLPQEADETRLALYEFAAAQVARLVPGRDVLYEPDRRRVVLTLAGVNRVLFAPRPLILLSVNQEELFQQVEQAVTAELAMRRERDYVIQRGEEKDEVLLIDESTGRPLQGRQWSDGLHQAVELKEGLDPSPRTGEAAKITLQSLLKQYRLTTGMTGTVAQSRGELKKLYRQSVSIIPTHRPSQRVGLPPRIFSTQAARQQAVAQAVEELLRSRRAALVGTASIHASEQLSELLREHGIPHQVLNARRLDAEAEIVARAGQPGAVTIATNMAGRGTDIKLHPEVQANGGLHVIATAMHNSVRIDRQLIGRAARQGDPGSYQFLLSLEDELLQATARRFPVDPAMLQTDRELPVSYLSWFERAQRLLEKQHRKARKELLRAERQRLKMARDLGIDPFTEFLG